MTEQQIIELKKKMSDFTKEARKEAKLDNCLYCGKEVTSFRKSHSVPHFILKNIENNGMVYNSNQFFEMPIKKNENGIGEAGTFYVICNDCDSKIFQDYEAEEILLNEPTNITMSEIALKNMLKYWGKRIVEVKVYERMKKGNPLHPSSVFGEYKNEINELDLKEIKSDFKRAKNIIEKNLKSGYHLMFWHKCDYIVPIAFQDGITIYGDLNGKVINDIYDENPSIRMQYLHICVFPLKDSSIIMVFYHKDDTNYKAFERQFNRISLQEKLNLISFIIANYSEDFFVSKKAQNEILNSDMLKETTQNVSDIIAFSFKEATDIKKGKLSELKRFKEFPNLLSEKYSIKSKE